MTFERPWALLLLAGLAVLLLLHRRRAPLVVRVASVEPYRAESGAPPPTTARRGFDPVLAALLGAALLLAVAAAEPVVARTGARVRVLVDRTVSMSAISASARAGDGTETVADAALARARSLIEAALPGAEVVVQDAPGPLDRDVDLQAAAVRGSGDAPGCVLATDRAVQSPAGDVVAIGPREPARPNVGILTASLDDPDAVVQVRNFGPAALRVRVTLGSEPPREIELGPSATVPVRFPAPARGARARFRVQPGGGLAADDVLTVQRRGGAARVRVVNAGPRVLAALRALSVEVVADPGADVDATVQHGGEIPADSDTPLVLFAPERSAPGAPLGVVDGGDTLGSAIVAPGEFPLPAPTAHVVATSRVSGGLALLEDASGALAARAGRIVVIALDPDAADSDWGRDGSFPAALGAALDWVTDGPDRLVAEDFLPEAEADLPTAALPDPAPESIRRLAARPAPTSLAGAAALLGAALAAVAALLGARR